MPSFPQHRLKNSDFRKEQLHKLREESKIDFNPNNSINKSSKSTMSNKVLVNVSKPTNVKNPERNRSLSIGSETNEKNSLKTSMSDESNLNKKLKMDN